MGELDRPLDDPVEDPVDPSDEDDDDTAVWPMSGIKGAQSQYAADSQRDPSEAEPARQEMPQDASHGPTPTDRPSKPAVDVSPRIFAAINQLNTLIEHRFTLLQTVFDREVRAEATRERIVDRLHAELQEYKQDLLLKVQRPIFIDLIQLHDDIGKITEAQAGDEPVSADTVRGILQSVRTAIEDTLYRQGVEPFQNEGDGFDPRRQRSVTTVPTRELERNKSVAARLRSGFQAGDKLVRPEIVSVYTFKNEE
jgi:molecular chaperone GrpE